MKKIMISSLAKVMMIGCASFGLTMSAYAKEAPSFSTSAASFSHPKFGSDMNLNKKITEQVSKGGNSRANELRKILANPKKRAEFEYVIDKCNELHLPKALALIPIIESRYTSKAVSPKGAGGMWQLMPQTAKGLGITNHQRFELAPSTVAALTYFKQLHQKYKNWNLVVASYNAGAGTVQKALNKNPNATSVQQLKLPLETRNYVIAFDQLRSDLNSYNV